jgi:hypothetical protein
LTKESDFDPKLLQTAVDLLNSQHDYAAADSLAAVLAAAVAGTQDSARRSKQIKRQRTTGSPANAATSDGNTAAAEAAADDDMEEDGELTAEAVEAEVSKLVAAWGSEVGAGPGSYEEAEEPYAAALQDLSVGVFDAAAAGAFNSQFSAMAAQPEGGRWGGCMMLHCGLHVCSATVVLAGETDTVHSRNSSTHMCLHVWLIHKFTCPFYHVSRSCQQYER